MVSPDLPRRLVDEVERTRLVEQLAERWVRTVTLIEAPAGFGKSTALAQAIRDNETDPSGIDHYVRLRRRHRDPSALVAAVLGPDTSGSPERADAGGGRDQRSRTPGEELLEWFAAHAPTPICLHLDDVHELDDPHDPDAAADDPDVVAMLREVVQQLPAHAHMVLSGRRLPALPLGRLRAADQVADVGAAELVFTPDERARLADHHGAALADLDRYEGWPAMTRLALAVGGSAPVDFLLEEVVDRLGVAHRVLLAAAVLLGELDDDLAVRLVVDRSAQRERSDGRPDGRGILDSLSAEVPLVVPVSDDRVRVHDLWGSVIERLVDAAERDRIVRIGIDGLIERGRPVEAVEVALAAARWADARRAVMAACRSDVHLSADLAERWLGLFPPDELDEPELFYLRGIVGRLRQVVGNGDDLVMAAVERFFERDDAVNEATAAFEVGMRAWLGNDVVRLLDVLGRAPRLVAAGIGEMASVLQMGDAAAAELQGDLIRAQRIATSIEVGHAPLEFAELVMRHASTLSFLVGHADEGLEHARRLAERNPSPRNCFVLDKARFQCGDPTEVFDRWSEKRTLSVGHSRDDFLLAVFASMVDASLGIMPDAERVRALAWERSREQTFCALVDAASLIVTGDEQRAATELANRLDEIGPSDPLALGELRRFGPYAWVLLPELRSTLVEQMGPMLLRRTEVAMALVAARDGALLRDRALPEPAAILTILPLPWSVELAARLADQDDRRGPELGAYLLDQIGAAALDTLRRCEGADDDRMARGAARLLAVTPIPPPVTTDVRLCGAMQVIHGDEAPVHPNRSRARQLLALLTVRGRMRRSEIIEVLWPELESERARNNLAQTLNYVRQLLEPGRRRGEAPFHLRQANEVVWLHRSPGLVIDIWEIEDRLDAADADRRAQRRRSAAGHLRGVAERWVGELAPDLRGFPSCAALLQTLDRRILDAVVALAQWSLAEDSIGDARRYAEQVLEHSPLEERAHSVLIGAALASGDLAVARAASDRAVGALTEFGLRPGSELRMLLRRLELRADTGTRDITSSAEPSAG